MAEKEGTIRIAFLGPDILDTIGETGVYWFLPIGKSEPSRLGKCKRETTVLHGSNPSEADRIPCPG